MQSRPGAIHSLVMMMGKNLFFALVLALGGGAAFHSVAGASPSATLAPATSAPQSRVEVVPGPEVFEASSGKCKAQCTEDAGDCRRSCKGAKCASDCNRAERDCKSSC
ncbi:MAG TPA: hypothetical protein VGC42_13320 [Kofleriaceae bacterium]